MRFAVVFLAFSIAACSGSAHRGQARPAQAGKMPIGSCTSVAPPRLLSPVNGSAGAPVRNVVVVVAYGDDPRIAFGNPALTSDAAKTVTGSPWKADGAGRWSSRIGALQPKTRYSVAVTNARCNQRYSIGYFATQ